ncbi:MAG TPA: hypothetical protein VGQ47_01560 [Candidatus Limnocylindrales bacterium]|jgi:hypothetical protein|nr:hypothetical protein [Candidatus Limnocylindrales bacterium]
MAAAFSITTGTNAIRLDAERRAVAVFTVVNETGRPLRARAAVSPFEPASPEWFSIEGEPERLFPLDGAETFTVRVAVPADAAAGRQAFRLDVVSVEHPDDEWAHGPAVGFEIAEPPTKPQPPPPKGYLESLLGALGGSVLGGLAGVVLGVVVFVAIFGFATVILAFVFWAALFAEFFVGLVAGGGFGIIVSLRRRALLAPEPWRTALPFGVLATLLGLIAVTVLVRLVQLTTLALPVQIVLVVVVELVVVIASALAGRAYSRFRALGML